MTATCSIEWCDRPGNGRFCSAHWWRHQHGVDMDRPFARVPVEDRFMAKVRKSPSGCWEWQASSGPGGRYGTFGVGDTVVRAHRWAYERWVAPLEPGQCVLHRCDNNKCVNPEHLWSGTQTENIEDMRAKGRARGLRGGDSPTAKLTDAQASEVRRRYLAGGISQAKLAEEFGVSQPTISRCVLRQRHGVE